RSNACDPERPDPLVGEGRCSRSTPIHPHSLRRCCVGLVGAHLLAAHRVFCNRSMRLPFRLHLLRGRRDGTSLTDLECFGISSLCPRTFPSLSASRECCGPISQRHSSIHSSIRRHRSQWTSETRRRSARSLPSKEDFQAWAR